MFHKIMYFKIDLIVFNMFNIYMFISKCNFM